MAAGRTLLSKGSMHHLFKCWFKRDYTSHSIAEEIAISEEEPQLELEGRKEGQKGKAQRAWKMQEREGNLRALN